MNAINYRSRQIALKSLISDRTASLEKLGDKEQELVSKVKQTMQYASNRLNRN
jgi:hypothetical protein